MNDIAKISGPTMSSREIAELTGKEHRNVLADIRKMLAELGKAAADFSAVAKIAGPNGSVREVEIFELPKRETLILVSGYSIQMRARIIDRWTELEARVGQPALSQSKLAGELAIAECFTRLLKPSPSSQVAMLAHIAKNNGIEPTFLPAYVVDAASDSTSGSSMETKPLTDLLIAHGISISARTYNRLLADAGMQAERTRRSTSSRAVNGTKRFWAITEAGLLYGKNITNPNSPRETQPHWYVERFADLHALVSSRVVGVAA
ncbi:Rha family transcriptional regulator [Caballeronia zhejiangensis]|uniref:Rha family transcriptional regulator n=1 Tax=Caballeronia zhejiangensis TaxID=871203 RepID=UPI001FD20C93|nr:Rha family transcriptional regulator [Caballeronia zhejiangensis]